MTSISFKTLEVWNIERAGNTKSIELIAIFNVENIENRLEYSLFNSQNNLISSLSFPRKYRKGEALYPKFFESDTPDGVITITGRLLDANNKQISNIAKRTLYMKKAQPASGIGQKALKDPTFNLPEFPQATTTASTTAQNAEMISAKVQKDIQDVYVTPEEARIVLKKEVTQEDFSIIDIPSISFPSIPQASAAEEINDRVTLNMVTQEILNFTIVDNRIQGTIKFSATNTFNPYYYNKTITNYLQLKSNGKVLKIKTNTLRFTEKERDEIINFDESAFDLNVIDIESYVWTNTHSALSNKLEFTIQQGTQPKEQHTGLMGAGVVGAIGILILLGFMADKMRKT